MKDGRRVRQTCISCNGTYTVKQEQLDADCLYHLCRKCRDRVKQAARRDKAGRA